MPQPQPQIYTPPKHSLAYENRNLITKNVNGYNVISSDLDGGENDWWKTIVITDITDESAVWYCDMISCLRAFGENQIIIQLSTYGGSAFGANMIASAIVEAKENGVEVIGKVVSHCFSAGTLLLAHCSKKVVMGGNTFLMYHKAKGGKPFLLNILNENILAYIESKGFSDAQLQDFKNGNDVYITGNEALNIGVVDEVLVSADYYTTAQYNGNKKTIGMNVKERLKAAYNAMMNGGKEKDAKVEFSESFTMADETSVEISGSEISEGKNVGFKFTKPDGSVYELEATLPAATTVATANGKQKATANGKQTHHAKKNESEINSAEQMAEIVLHLNEKNEALQKELTEVKALLKPLSAPPKKVDDHSKQNPKASGTGAANDWEFE